MKKKAFYLLLVVLFSLSSCMTIPLAKSSIGDTVYIRAKVFQALNENEALAIDEGVVIKIITTKELFYDGKEVSGYYKMIDTYTYKTKDNSTKTVPVLIKVSEFNDPKPLQEKKPEGQKL